MFLKVLWIARVMLMSIGYPLISSSRHLIGMLRYSSSCYLSSIISNSRSSIRWRWRWWELTSWRCCSCNNIICRIALISTWVIVLCLLYSTRWCSSRRRWRSKDYVINLFLFQLKIPKIILGLLSTSRNKLFDFLEFIFYCRLLLWLLLLLLLIYSGSSRRGTSSWISRWWLLLSVKSFY